MSVIKRTHSLFPGMKGDQGERGPVGQKGERGREGSVGNTGAGGENGMKGEMGEKGEVGTWVGAGPGLISWNQCSWANLNLGLDFGPLVVRQSEHPHLFGGHESVYATFPRVRTCCLTEGCM